MWQATCIKIIPFSLARRRALGFLQCVLCLSKKNNSLSFERGTISVKCCYHFTKICRCTLNRLFLSYICTIPSYGFNFNNHRENWKIFRGVLKYLKQCTISYQHHKFHYFALRRTTVVIIATCSTLPNLDPLNMLFISLMALFSWKIQKLAEVQFRCLFNISVFSLCQFISYMYISVSDRKAFYYRYVTKLGWRV